MKEKENYGYELAKALVLNFFDGHYYLSFESVSEVEEFLEFIGCYDNRFSKDFEKKKFIKEVYWKYSIILHHHQLEWNSKKDLFKKYDAIELPYKKVKPYICEWVKLLNEINSLFPGVTGGKEHT